MLPDIRCPSGHQQKTDGRFTVFAFDEHLQDKQMPGAGDKERADQFLPAESLKAPRPETRETSNSAW